MNAIAEGLIDFSDAKEQMKNIKFAIFELQDKLNLLTNKVIKEPDWDTFQITQEQFEILSFGEQREVIRSAIESIILNNSYAIIKYTFPRSKSGSYEARINLARGNQQKPRLVKRTSKQLSNITNDL